MMGSDGLRNANVGMKRLLKMVFIHIGMMVKIKILMKKQ